MNQFESYLIDSLLTPLWRILTRTTRWKILSKQKGYSTRLDFGAKNWDKLNRFINTKKPSRSYTCFIL